jgi:hypothetical protein
MTTNSISPMSTVAIRAICDAVMDGVVAAGFENLDTAVAVDVIRTEIRSLILGDEYANERGTLIDRTVSEATVVTSVIASCIIKIDAARTGA